MTIFQFPSQKMNEVRKTSHFLTPLQKSFYFFEQIPPSERILVGRQDLSRTESPCLKKLKSLCRFPFSTTPKNVRRIENPSTFLGQSFFKSLRFLEKISRAPFQKPRIENPWLLFCNNLWGLKIPKGPKNVRKDRKSSDIFWAIIFLESPFDFGKIGKGFLFKPKIENLWREIRYFHSDAVKIF